MQSCKKKKKRPPLIELILGDAMRAGQPAGPKTGLRHAMTNKEWARKRKGKLINAAAHASFLFQGNNTIIVQQGLWHGLHGGGWLFCKINNLENRFLRFLAPVSNVGRPHTYFKNKEYYLRFNVDFVNIYIYIYIFAHEVTSLSLPAHHEPFGQMLNSNSEPQIHPLLRIQHIGLCPL